MQRQNKPNPNLVSQQQDPQSRLNNLKARLAQLDAIKDLTADPKWVVVESTIRELLNQKRRDRDSLDPNNPESLRSHGDRALYMTGFIHGAEYLPNHITALLKEEETIRRDIKEVETEINKKKRGGDTDD